MRKNKLSLVFIVFVLFLCLVGAGYLMFKDLDAPELVINPQIDRVSPATTLKISLNDPSGIRSLSVGIRKNAVYREFFQTTFEQELPQRELTLSLRDVALPDGAFEMEFCAIDASFASFGSGNSRTVSVPMRLDLTPPKLSVRNNPPTLTRGGTGVIRYSADEEISKSGVFVGDHFVPGFRQKDGSYICFFPFPYNMEVQDFKNAVELTATDLAGNVTRNALAVTAIDKKYKRDTLRISDKFLENVDKKLGEYAPKELDLLERYLHINITLRQENANTLDKLRKDTADAIFWEGAFLRMPRSKDVAGFADFRSCIYNGDLYTTKGKKVGEYYHLGADFASIKNDKIPVANSGRVLFADNLGIYGNTVLIDHGLGVMTLYGHMSEITVKVGDVVQKGQIIGRTGMTGLAFGDHLHFGILVGGIEVLPQEWLDPRWVRNHILSRISD